MTAAVPDSQEGFLQPWRDKLDGWLSNPRLESFVGEQALESLALELRYQWLHHAHAQSGKFLMSPPHRQRKYLPDQAAISFPYDRWLRPEGLEHRLNVQQPAPVGWVGSSVVFASGMAALTTFLQHFRAAADRFWPPKRRTRALHWFGGYFEITRALRLLCDDAFSGRRHSRQETLFDVVAAGGGDVVLIEPVAADLHLEVFDVDGFVDAWNKREATRPCVIVLDTSLVGDSFPVQHFCEALGKAPQPPVLVVQIRSGLKLDQQGLELANVGLATLYAPTADAQMLEQFSDSLRLARTTFGASLSQDEYAALSAPFFLDAASFNQHAQAVLANNAAFAQALAPVSGGLLTEVIHPVLGPDAGRAWAVSPFVNLRYASGEEDDRGFLHALLTLEAQKRALTFQSGSSFGFRGHRYEMGFVRGVKFDTLRVALGSRAGPSLNGVIQLFQDLAAYPDFAALRAAYPQINGPTPKAPILTNS